MLVRNPPLTSTAPAMEVALVPSLAQETDARGATHEDHSNVCVCVCEGVICHSYVFSNNNAIITHRTECNRNKMIGTVAVYDMFSEFISVSIALTPDLRRAVDWT